MSGDRNSFDINIKKSGWLMKQSRYTKTWKKTWFILESSQLLYGDTELGPFKKIPLHATMIEEANIADKKYIFRLKPLNSNRDYLIQAPDESEEEMWMQAICFAKVSAHKIENASTCVLQ